MQAKIFLAILHSEAPVKDSNPAVQNNQSCTAQQLCRIGKGPADQNPEAQDPPATSWFPSPNAISGNRRKGGMGLILMVTAGNSRPFQRAWRAINIDAHPAQQGGHNSGRNLLYRQKKNLARPRQSRVDRSTSDRSSAVLLLHSSARQVASLLSSHRLNDFIQFNPSNQRERELVRYSILSHPIPSSDPKS